MHPLGRAFPCAHTRSPAVGCACRGGGASRDSGHVTSTQLHVAEVMPHSLLRLRRCPSHPTRTSGRGRVWLVVSARRFAPYLYPR